MDGEEKRDGLQPPLVKSIVCSVLTICRQTQKEAVQTSAVDALAEHSAFWKLQETER